ncbi:sensor histidine kinase [Streptococcus parasanguinis]|uniref:sensor histidine kinase n=1 Tax=Streptococcus parasanguinis TaxID=1318 RepID=UPI0039C21764
MRKFRGVRYSLAILMVVNFIAVMLNSIIYLQATNYIIAQRQASLLVERLERIPFAPSTTFWLSALLFAGIALISMSRYRSQTSRWSIFDKWNILEILLMLLLMWVQNVAYNGLILLVFADIFYGSKELNTKRDRKYWFAFILVSFLMLLVTNSDVFSLFFPIPSLDVYIHFYPASIRILAFFLKNSLYALNMVLFIISLLFYIMNVLAENHEVEEELAIVSKVNTELNNYMALSEKIAEDRERKRIAREIHDTLGHALTGISAGLDAVGVLIDIDPNRAKEQVKSVSEVVREGIQDVRGSLNRLRPGALEGRTLKDALEKMIREYQTLSNLQVDLHYEWVDVDMDVMIEDTIFRVIQESMTNAVRHGHASRMILHFFEDEEDYLIELQDNGVGFETLTYGYGLKQMMERISILGGQLQFESRDGFFTHVSLPKYKEGR